MNTPIRTLAVACLVLFLALLGNITYVQFFQAKKLNAMPTNRRVLVDEFSRERGAILVDGSAVAESVPSGDRWDYQRTYPAGPLYAPVTGYFSWTYGRSAIEQSENPVLSGSDDRLFLDRVIDLLSNQSPQGGSVELTINPAAQTAGADGLAALGPGTQGAVVAIEPSTGRILAMVTLPSYDPNALASHDLTAIQQSWESLTADPSQPMLNRTSQLRLAPGSTFKLVTAAAAIKDLGLKADSPVQGGYELQFSDTNAPLPNEEVGSCGTDQISFEQALSQSCNVSFGALAIELGQDKIVNQAEAFGFDARPIDSVASVKSQVLSNPDQTLSQSQLAFTGIGQYDVQATPLQMAMVAAGIANDGKVMKPYLVQTLRAPNLEVLDQTEPELLSTAMTPADAATLTQMMVAVVDSGTGRNAQISGVQVAGKTGTAESGLEPPNPSAYTWFVSFAPADNPQVAVAVLVQDSGTSKQLSGGARCAPIAKSVMEAVLQ